MRQQNVEEKTHDFHKVKSLIARRNDRFFE